MSFESQEKELGTLLYKAKPNDPSLNKIVNMLENGAETDESAERLAYCLAYVKSLILKYANSEGDREILFLNLGLLKGYETIRGYTERRRQYMSYMGGTLTDRSRIDTMANETIALCKRLASSILQKKGEKPLGLTVPEDNDCSLYPPAYPQSSRLWDRKGKGKLGKSNDSSNSDVDMPNEEKLHFFFQLPLAKATEEDQKTPFDHVAKQEDMDTESQEEQEELGIQPTASQFVQPRYFQQQYVQPQDFQLPAYRPQNLEQQDSLPQGFQPPAYQPQNLEQHDSMPQYFQSQDSQPQDSQSQYFQPQYSQPQDFQPPAYQPQNLEEQDSRSQYFQSQDSQPRDSQSLTYLPQCIQPQVYQPQEVQPEEIQERTLNDRLSELYAERTSIFYKIRSCLAEYVATTIILQDFITGHQWFSNNIMWILKNEYEDIELLSQNPTEAMDSFEAGLYSFLNIYHHDDKEKSLLAQRKEKSFIKRMATDAIWDTQKLIEEYQAKSREISIVAGKPKAK